MLSQQSDRLLIVIPARMSSQRLPGKPLAEIMGVPMIVHVWQRACLAEIAPVVVAAADTQIVEIIEAAGGRAVLTNPALCSGSDRVAAAVEQLDPEERYDMILNLQGDLPDMTSALLHGCLLALTHADIGTAVSPVASPDLVSLESGVKAAVAFAEPSSGGAPQIARVLYFSRCLIPWGRGPIYHHIGIYAWKRESLRRFSRLQPSLLERRERLEQLRALEAGMRIDAVLADSMPLAVDTPEDLARARILFKERLFKERASLS